MGNRSSAGTALALTVAAGFVASVFAPAVLAAGNGLPRTYTVQRVDSPQPEDSGLFSLSLNLAGDLNGDGRQDVISPQVANFNTAGRVYVFSGANGALIDTITAPDPGGAGGNAQFGLLGTAKVGVNRTSPPYTDLGSCADGRTSVTCATDLIGPPDGVPDLLISATGVDVGGVTDVGRVYVIDGATRAVLKRIDMPPADRALTAGAAGFGREVLAPEGLPPCEANGGIGSCETMPLSVAIGDMDGGGRPDVVVGARRVNETPGTSAPGSHCSTAAPGATCNGAGRAYVFRGEDIVQTNPAVILDGTSAGQLVRTIRNPDAQADNPMSAINTDGEGFGNDLMPIGDVGRCTNAALLPGDRCPRAASTTTPDGRPEVVVMAPGVDYPLANPDPAFSETGAAYLVDGATGTILHTYLHPEPQRAGAFGGSFEHSLATGDMGDTGAPDIALGAPGQNGAFTASGRSYVMSGAFKTSASLTNIARLNDPTPHVTEENFGGSSAGVGDLVPGAAAPRNELMVGQSGPRVGPFVSSDQPLDVAFFNPSTEKALQIVPDPDAQTSSAFGDSIEPLGDLNDDGFLDFAVGAFRYVGASGLIAGRFYIFRSDNSPAPPPADTTPPPPPAAAPAPAAPAVTLAGRTLSLRSSARSVRPNGTIRLSGTLAASANAGACLAGHEVQLQRRASGQSAFATFARSTTAPDGTFSGTDRPGRGTRYRAIVVQTTECLGAESADAAVAVVAVARLVTKRPALTRRGIIRIQLACPASTPPRSAAAACRGSVRLRTRSAIRRPGRSRARLTIGTATYRMDAGARRTLRIRVSRANRIALRSARSVRVTVAISNRNAEGDRLASQGSLRLRTR